LPPINMRCPDPLDSYCPTPEPPEQALPLRRNRNWMESMRPMDVTRTTTTRQQGTTTDPGPMRWERTHR
ncbi:Hypothetical predicted protein, partial [Pelobates cultripes]